MKTWITHTIEPWMPIGATKAKDDVARIANENGWQTLSIDRANEAIELASVAAGDIVLHQYPSYLDLTWEIQLVNNLHQRNAKIALLIHDIESLRIDQRETNELALFNEADLLVVHNMQMRQALTEAGIQTPMLSLGLFDYLVPEDFRIQQHPAPRPYKAQFIFAGTPAKSEWLQTYQGHTPIQLFGQVPQKWDALPTTIHVNEPVEPATLPSVLPNGYGLLADSGSYHDYEALNSPHKLSLYLASGLPVMIWEGAALAKFVKHEQLGITYQELAELDELMANYDDDIYEHYQGHVWQYVRNVQRGTYTKIMLKRVIDQLNR